MTDASDLPPYAFNLVILHTPHLQDVADFMIIRNMLLGQAPDIRTLIISVDQGVTPVLVKAIREHPTLIFAPVAIDLPAEIRGTRLVGEHHSKEEELALLSAAGVPVPRSAVMRRADDLPTVDLGPLVVVKPNHGMQGKDVNLIRADHLAAYAATALDRPAKALVVQEWIDTGSQPASYRVMTVLGQPVYCLMSRSVARAVGAPEGIPPGGLPIAANGQERTMACVADEPVVRLAQDVHEALPQFPVLGIDIIRDRRTGKLFVLEINAGGYTWHLSSNYGKLQQRQHGLDLYNQFDALNGIARAMIAATRRLAS